VINAAKIRLTGRKLTDKIYYRRQYPGGLRATAAGRMLSEAGAPGPRCGPGMLPKNRLSRRLITKLKVYTGGAPARRAAGGDRRGQIIVMAQQAQTYQSTAKRKWRSPGQLSAGEGRILVNERPLDEYWSARPRDDRQPAVRGHRDQDRYDVTVNVRGGGVAAQASAIRHGISRALLTIDPETRPRSSGRVT
jgi:ribosomal protein S9